jgi:hypothetical protein
MQVNYAYLDNLVAPLLGRHTAARCRRKQLLQPLERQYLRRHHERAHLL